MQQTHDTNYEIREANQSDVFDLTLSVKQFCKEIPHPAWRSTDSSKIKDVITQIIDHPEGFVKVASYNGEIIGALIGFINSTPINHYKFSQEIMFWFDPEHRNGKVSHKLIDDYVDWSKQNNCSFARLSSLDELLGSRVGVLFKRKGFTPIETAYVKEL